MKDLSPHRTLAMDRSVPHQERAPRFQFHLPLILVGFGFSRWYISHHIYLSGYSSIARQDHSSPSLLQNISEIEVGIWRPFQLRLIKPLVLNFRTTLIISAFLRNVSLMRRLYTARFFGIKVEPGHLALLFQSNYLQHLILSQCSLPGLFASLRHTSTV